MSICMGSMGSSLTTTGGGVDTAAGSCCRTTAGADNGEEEGTEGLTVARGAGGGVLFEGPATFDSAPMLLVVR